MGRHAAFLDDLVTQKIVAAVKAGATRDGAAKVAGIGRSTLQSWLQRGRDGDEPYAGFLDKIRKAEGDLEKRLVTLALALAEHAENEAVRAKMIDMLLNVRCGWGKTREATSADAAGASEQIADVEFFETLLSAAKSRRAG